MSDEAEPPKHLELTPMKKYLWMDFIPKEELAKHQERAPFGKPLVIDNGTGFTKHGFAGEDDPRSVFPTLVGFPKYPETKIEGFSSIGGFYVGEEATNFEQKQYPLEKGIIRDWDAMDRVWQYSFNSLQINPLRHCVLLSVSPFISEQDRIKITEIFFETYEVPGLRIQNNGALALYTSGRTTGLVVDIGEEQTRIIPIYEGFIIRNALQIINIGGKNLTNYLQRLLRQQYSTSSAIPGYRTCERVKEQLCYVAFDPETEVKMYERSPNLHKKYALPNGDNIALTSERFLVPEALFNPAVMNQQEKTLHEAIYTAIQKCDSELRKELYLNIVLTGGSTMFPGFKERLHKELVLMNEDLEVKIIAPPERWYSVWVGGSVLASLKTFSGLWVSRLEYIVNGTNVVGKFL